jgi:CubicO group peptidase (beta-lactamase class C family)
MAGVERWGVPSLCGGAGGPTTVLAKAQGKAALRHPGRPLKDFIADLAPLPLAFQPGQRWEYSVATDVLSRLIEGVSGQTFGTFIPSRIFEPLGMAETDFHVPESKTSRLLPDSPTSTAAPRR